MIKSLRIKNLATIEDIELFFDEGFSILTGETGTGKSIIIDGIRLALGEKGSTDIIRTGKIETSVETIFFLDQERDHLAPFSLDRKNEFYIQRNISEQGSGKGYINGTLVPVKKLKEIRDCFVDIYGQNDHIFIRQIENQLNYLDHYANSIVLRKKVASIAQALKKLVREKTDIEKMEKEREQRLEFLDFQINEIETAQLVPGEEERIRQERNILKNAERIRSLIEEALNLSYSQENSTSSHLSKLQNIASQLSSFDQEFRSAEKTIGQFSIFIREFSDFLFKFREKHTASPEKLESQEQRLSLIENFKRKYGNSIDKIISFLEKIKEEHNALSTSQEKLSELNKEIEVIFNEYKTQAQNLSLLRKKHALELEKQIKNEIGLLGMKKAIFKIEIKSSSPNLEEMERLKDSGIDEVEFLISPNPGEEPKPMRKIASGGELSRIMLALKSIGKDTERLKTLIFDEIDSGIGGKTAEFVAKKLNALAEDNQVICISHLPQIASFATHHYKIEKKIEKNRTFTMVKKLTFEERVDEIARLLAGSHITETALQNAREMLSHNLKESR